ncbi:stress-response A/B barrel domain-containing protein UP3 [Cyclospora cayetanensis]|uniref:Stress-response A/B barrel domain-containing protein UP3 n=2 Tax=Cyclospora cayetanensis TaxID=88456 RepID=A0A6P5WE64_9EIME|nr:stress-response A/B barrel domain-containing protein UP3 [Cyclospora cayetanensis]OEH79601.1 hypothetical protein cyc_06973 [Cyclospora cayetanensis]
MAAVIPAFRVVHVVCFKFKPDTPPSALLNMATEAEALPECIKGMPFAISFRPTFTHERARGFTHVLYSQFSNAEDLNRYSSHPAHTSFVAKYKPFFEDVMAVDIEL